MHIPPRARRRAQLQRIKHHVSRILDHFRKKTKKEKYDKREIGVLASTHFCPCNKPCCSHQRKTFGPRFSEKRARSKPIEILEIDYST